MHAASRPGYAATLDRGTTANRCGAWLPLSSDADLQQRPVGAGATADPGLAVGDDRSAPDRRRRRTGCWSRPGSPSRSAASGRRPGTSTTPVVRCAQLVVLTVGETWSLPTWIAPAIAGWVSQKLSSSWARTMQWLGAREPLGSTANLRANAQDHDWLRHGRAPGQGRASQDLHRLLTKPSTRHPPGAATPPSAGST